MTIQLAKAQTDHLQVEKTLQNYIEGSSYNKLDLLKSAFAENATLYLTMGTGVFKRLSPADYAELFKNNPSGKFNGRYGKVLSVSLIKDIATAKVEIRIPARKMVYIDLFLLKRTDSGWKIISKTATRIDDAN
ncbi:hypothetical protein GCM10011416_15720 [Polaribacter pacificus]|uniref:Lumazine-binding n=2 Tax=Polaribacter pacificus TaxID=1775173 RepID=A0A917HZR7_9FLAO|nr:hypothetical protein GCM10011416_15720 [Polaribacter pacificus]